MVSMERVDLSDETILALRQYDTLVRDRGLDGVYLHWPTGSLCFESGASAIEDLARPGFVGGLGRWDFDDTGLSVEEFEMAVAHADALEEDRWRDLEARWRARKAQESESRRSSEA